MIKSKLMNNFQMKELHSSSNEYNASNFRKFSSQNTRLRHATIIEMI